MSALAADTLILPIGEANGSGYPVTLLHASGSELPSVVIVVRGDAARVVGPRRSL